MQALCVSYFLLQAGVLLLMSWRHRNPSRMKTKIFLPFMLLLPMKIILLCVMLQTYHYLLILGTFLPSSGVTISGDSLGLDQIYSFKSKRILKYLHAGFPNGWDNCRLPSLQCMKIPQNQNGPLQATYKGLASCQTQTFKNHSLWAEWCYGPSNLTLGLFWFVCVNKNWNFYAS